MTQTTANWRGDISDQIRARRSAYGGSDPTAPSFVRPQYVRHNTVSKSLDFGRLDNLLAQVGGLIGGATGAQTLFFQVTLNGPADLRIIKLAGNPREDQYISVGVLGPDRKPLALASDGFALLTDIHGTVVDESQDPLPVGTYTFTVSSSIWQQLPFGVLLQVLRYKELIGEISLEGLPVLRLSNAQLRGSASLSDLSSALLSARKDVDALAGAISGGDATSGSLTIPRGVISGSLLLEGRIRVNWRITGEAGGALEASGSLSVGGSGGYG